MNDNVIPIKKDEGFRSTDPLVSFLYTLLRDHLPAGEVELITREAEKHHDVAYSNSYLAGYASNIASRLQRK